MVGIPALGGQHPSHIHGIWMHPSAIHPLLTISLIVCHFAQFLGSKQDANGYSLETSTSGHRYFEQSHVNPKLLRQRYL